MIVLAFDTAAARASLAVLEDAHLLASSTLEPDAAGHAHRLFSAIEAVLAAAGRRLDDVDCFAAGSGPGSFTGVRVALSAAKGLAETCGKPVVPVSNLAAIAWYGTSPLRAPYLDARRGEIFGAVYNAHLEIVQPETAAPFDQWRAALPPGTELIDGASVDGKLATAVAHIAAARMERGEAMDPAAVDANYVRRADAELKWVDR